MQILISAQENKSFTSFKAFWEIKFIRWENSVANIVRLPTIIVKKY